MMYDGQLVIICLICLFAKQLPKFVKCFRTAKSLETDFDYTCPPTNQSLKKIFTDTHPLTIVYSAKWAIFGKQNWDLG